MTLNIQCCTLTGVDDSTPPQDLVALSDEFPRVEWGFLYSPKRQGLPGRYPSVATLQRALLELPPQVNVALHVCGTGVHDLLAGEPVVEELVELVAARQGRVQLNFNQNKEPIDLRRLNVTLSWYPNLTFITQHNEANRGIWQALQDGGFANHAVLFDASGGRGLVPEQWPQPLPGVTCGYAGGLSSDNLTFHLDAIAALVGDRKTWIDMEGSLRLPDQEGIDWFNLARCRACLDAVQGWMSRQDAQCVMG